MESFYKIGREPSLDNLADYLAMFIRWRYRNDKIVLGGLSFGFLVATRMLQRHPKLQDKVKLFVSIVGFAHRDDFSFSRPRFLFYKYGSAFFTLRLPAYFFQHVVLQPFFIRRVYQHSFNAKSKFDGKSGDELKRTMDFEVNLWRINDLRTQMYCNGEMLRLDLCNKQVNLPIYHVSVDKDQYFDNKVVEQHFRVIFSDYHGIKAKVNNHSVSVVSDKKMAEPMVPAELKRILRSSAA
jgi:pimeloyl-ACP methyl ester carboxylesterase